MLVKMFAKFMPSFDQVQEKVFGQSTEERIRLAVCKILRGQDKRIVGCGVLVCDPGINDHISKYCIITSKEEIKIENFLDGSINQVKFSKKNKEMCFDLKDFSKSVQDLPSAGLILIFIDENHRDFRHRCLPMTNLDQDQQPFCYLANQCYNIVKSSGENGEYVLEAASSNSDTSVKSTTAPDEIPNGTVILQRANKDVRAVGVFNVVDRNNLVVSPIWLKSSISGILGSEASRLNQGTKFKQRDEPDSSDPPSRKLNDPPIPSEEEYKFLSNQNGISSGGPIRGESGKAEEGNSGLKKVKKDDLVAEIIYGNPCVMDELRLKLDFPVVKVPLKYWPHLAHILGASEKTRKLCQQNSDYKPSARMFTHLSATSPSYTVAELKGVLKKIERSDLISVLENSSIKDTDRLTAISQREPNKFHEICLKLDCSKVNNWRDLGEAMCISEDILEKCERPGEYTEEVLKIIYTRQPELSMEEIKYALKEMNRGDVLEQLNKLPVESTIKILLNNAEVLQEFTRLLDKETPDGKNWQDFAQKFGVAKEECDYLCPVNGDSPTDLLMEYLSTAYPKLTLHTFMDALLQMDREDVVEESLKKFFDHIDIDVIKIKLH